MVQRVRIMVLTATFSNISAILWQSVLLVEATAVPRENHRPATSHWQTWAHIMLYRFKYNVHVCLAINGISIWYKCSCYLWDLIQKKTKGMYMYMLYHHIQWCSFKYIFGPIAIGWLVFQENTFKQILCYFWQCLLMDRNEISNLDRGPSTDDSNHVWFIWLSCFREDFLEIDQPEKRIAYNGGYVC